MTLQYMNQTIEGNIKLSEGQIAKNRPIYNYKFIKINLQNEGLL